MALGACNNNNDEFDESYYAGNASVNSSDSSFYSTASGGTISFQAEGGQVLLNVDCDIDWTVANSGSSWLTTTADNESNTLTVTAPQNYVEDVLTATITFKTAKSGIEFATVTVTQGAYSPTALSVGATEWHVPAVGALSTDITVSATEDYEISKNADWLTVTKTDTGITLTAVENETTEARSDEVTITCTDGYTTEKATIAVTQDAKVSLTLSSTETIAFTAEGGSASITVESNFSWTPSTEADWITFQTSGNTLTIVAAAEVTGEDQEATVTVTAGDGAENVATGTITVTEEAKDVVSLILVYTITNDDVEITLPITGDVNCTVDWGDGSEKQTVTEANPTHTYAQGEYRVSISGQVTTLNSYSIMSNKKNLYDEANTTLYLTAVEQWGNTGLTKMTQGFYGCVNLKSIPADTQGSFAEVNGFGSTFYGCVSLEEIPAGLFAYATIATGWGACFGSMNITSIPEGLFDACVGMTSFGGFVGCSSLKSIPDGLFANCTALTDFEDSFSGCTSLEAIPEDLLKNCTGCWRFGSAFYGCSSLKSLPAGLFSSITRSTDMNNAFYNCTGLTGETPYSEITVDGQTVKVHLYERENYPDYFGDADGEDCFRNCTGLSDYDTMPDYWK